MVSMAQVIQGIGVGYMVGEKTGRSLHGTDFEKEGTSVTETAAGQEAGEIGRKSCES